MMAGSLPDEADAPDSADAMPTKETAPDGVRALARRALSPPPFELDAAEFGALSLDETLDAFLAPSRSGAPPATGGEEDAHVTSTKTTIPVPGRRKKRAG